MAQDNDRDGFYGFRYLMDANNGRQYAIQFDNGKPKKPIRVFAANPGQAKFAPNETVFALDDEFEVTMQSGKPKVSTVMTQIITGEKGEPRSLKLQGVEYDVTFTTGETSPKIVYTLSAHSAAELKNYGFDVSLPKSFSSVLQQQDMTAMLSGAAGGVKDGLANLPFPPHHYGGALIARMADPAGDVAPAAPIAQARKPTPPLSPWSKADDQTLVHVKGIGNGEKLKTVFDFEARRVTEVYAGQGAAMTGHSFAEHDPAALEDARQKLVELQGKPRPLDDKKFPGLKG